jgi:AcrR family transcriptional regulator
MGIRVQELNVVHTLKVVQKLTRAHLSVVPDDRRQRARDKKRQQILLAADGLIAEAGLRGITMQGVADRLDCAVGTLYLYFPSKAALIAALQGDAIDTLRASFAAARPAWDEYLAESDLSDELAALVRLTGFGAHWASASVVFADEFHLQRTLLSEPVAIEATEEVRDSLPVLQRLLESPSELLDAGAELGVLDAGNTDERALRWLAALNGVLLLENLAAVDRHLFRAQHLARLLTHDLLCGWGAARADVEVAAAHVERLAALGPLAPPPG